MVVLGTVHGNVEVTDKIEIRRDAKLVGDIKTSRIVIEDGAYFKGSIDIKKQEVKPAAAPVISTPPVQVPGAAAPAAAAAVPVGGGAFKR